MEGLMCDQVHDYFKEILKDQVEIHRLSSLLYFQINLLYNIQMRAHSKILKNCFFSNLIYRYTKVV